MAASTISLKLVNYLTVDIPRRSLPWIWSQNVDEKMNRQLFNSSILKTMNNTNSSMLSSGGEDTYGYVHIDGYYVIVAVLTLSGILWMIVFRKQIRRLQGLEKSNWNVFLSE
jgi:hypothetical protein